MDVKNVPEKFFREIRKVEIYPADALKYKDNYTGQKPTGNPLYTFSVIPENFTHKFPTKIKSGNYYYEPDFGFPLVDLSITLRNQLYRDLNKKEFAIGLVSNVETIYFGNDREPITVQITDDLKNDNSGEDQFYISIFGNTILPPKAKIN